MYELSWKESTDHFDRHHFFFFSTYIQCTNNFCIDQTFDDVTHTHIHENDRIFAALHFHSWLPTKQLKEDYHVRVTERVDNAKNDTGQKKKKHKKSAALHSMQTIQSRMLCRVDKFMAISPLVVFRYLLLLLYFHFFCHAISIHHFNKSQHHLLYIGRNESVRCEQSRAERVRNTKCITCNTHFDRT